MVDPAVVDAGASVTIGLVIEAFAVSTVVVTATLWIIGRIGRVETRALAAVAELKKDTKERIDALAHDVAALKEDLADHKLDITRRHADVQQAIADKYLSKDGGREMVAGVLREVLLRIDGLEAKISMRRPARGSAPRVRPPRSKAGA